MSNATFLNKLQTAAGQRPASLFAAATLPIASLWAVDYGFGRLLPEELKGVGLFIMIGMEFLQWTSFGRLAALNDVNAEAQASALRRQMVILALFQVAGYTLTIVGAAPGWGSGWALAGVITFAGLFAYLNLTTKWTSADAAAPFVRRNAAGIPIGQAALPCPAEGSTPPGDRAPSAVEAYRQNLCEREIAGYSKERHGLRLFINPNVDKPAPVRVARDPSTGRFLSLRDLDARTGDLFCREAAAA